MMYEDIKLKGLTMIINDPFKIKWIFTTPMISCEQLIKTRFGGNIGKHEYN